MSVRSEEQKAVTVGGALSIMKELAPDEYEYKNFCDNIGLILGRENALINKILVCLDVTEAVIDEAIAVGAGLIVSHHPMIFNPIKKITSSDVLGRKLLKAAENRIAVYAAHTNLDFCPSGINDYMASLLSLRNVTVLEPYANGGGLGRVGDLGNLMFCSVLKGEVENVLKDNYVRVIGQPYAQVGRVAVINGAGGGDTAYVDMAVAAGADCLITADVKHHVAMYALESGITVIEPQHFTMEYSYISRLVLNMRIEAKARNLDVEVVQSTVELNPRF